MSSPILVLDKVKKVYSKGLFSKEVTFSIEADFTVEKPAIIGMMGVNGAGKTTLFEMMTGSNPPTEGRVVCLGQDIQNIKYHERDRMAIHYHQSYQVRKIKRTKPNFMLESSSIEYPIIHLFDEPQFNPQDGYIGFMLDFFEKLRNEGRLVFICLHPTENYQLGIMEEMCEKFMFVKKDPVKFSSKVYHYDTYKELMQDKECQSYLGDLA